MIGAVVPEDRDLYPLRPLAGTEGKATFSVSAEALEALGLAPQEAARMDLGDLLRVIVSTVRG